MTSAISMTVSRREAAVAAALAGTVVVVLGYASGLGVKVESPTTAQLPVQPAAPVAPAEEQAAPVAAVPDIPADAMGDVPMSHDFPVPTEPTTQPTSEPTTAPTDEPTSDPTATPTSEPTTTPTTEPTSDPAAGCPPGLLGDVPVVGPVTAPLTEVLGEFLAASVLGGVAGPPTTETPGPVSCVVGVVLGPQCCDAATSEQAGVGP